MTIGSHQAPIGASQTHLTPRWIIDAIGPFDLDPCAAPSPRPWPTARAHVELPADGLAVEWFGRVWLNPPFDRRVVGNWIARLADHGNGICLLHARTEARWFRPVWERAESILFLDRRIHFCRADGEPHPANSGAPVLLAAFGSANARALRGSGIGGRFVTDWCAVGARSIAAGDAA